MSILAVFKSLYILLSLTGGSFLPTNVLFESVESKTSEGKSVFNRISLDSSSLKDIWTMRQSHSGKNASDWDLIQITVDKTKSPFTASYSQLNPKGEEIEYRTSCFRCHSGGPRYIRPVLKDLSLKERLTIQKWNWLIKSYGDVKTKRNIKVKRLVSIDEGRQILNVKGCISCHYAGGPRAPITSEQKLTVRHLVKAGQMPPWPYSLSKEDKEQVNKFIYGF